MIDYTEIAHDTDGWEQFARDFLSARGFYIESEVDPIVQTTRPGI